MSHDYCWKYYGRPLKWQRSRFFSFLALAWKYTEEKCFVEEFNRLYNQTEIIADIPFGGSLKKLIQHGDVLHEWEKLIGCKKVSGVNPEQSESGLLSVLPAIIGGLDRDGFLRAMLPDMLEYGITTLRKDYLGVGLLTYDMLSGRFEPLTITLPARVNMNNPFASVYAPYQRGGMGSCMLARAAVDFAKVLDRDELVKLTRQILENIGVEHLTWIEDHFHVLPEELRWMDHVFSGDAATHWLWAYWQLQLDFPE